MNPIDSLHRFCEEVEAIVPKEGGDERYAKILLQALPSETGSIPVEKKTFLRRVFLFLFGWLPGVREKYNIEKISQTFYSTIRDARAKGTTPDIKRSKEHFNGILRYYASQALV